MIVVLLHLLEEVDDDQVIVVPLNQVIRMLHLQYEAHHHQMKHGKIPMHETHVITPVRMDIHEMIVVLLHLLDGEP